MANYNPVIGRDPWTDLATFTADTEDASYPAANLGSVDLNRPYKATANHAVISFVLSRPSPVGMVVLLRHQQTQGAQLRLQLYSDNAFSTQRYDSSTDAMRVGGQDMWPTAYGFNQLDFEDDNWLTWQYLTSQLKGKPKDRPLWLNDRRYLIQSGRLTVTNPFNANPVQIGRLEICRGYQFSRGLAMQGGGGYASQSAVTAADGGKEYGNLKLKPRVFNNTFPVLPRAEAELIKEIKDQHDIVPEQGLYWHPFPTDTTLWLRNSFYARFSQLDLHQFSTPTRDSVPVSLREIM